MSCAGWEDWLLVLGAPAPDVLCGSRWDALLGSVLLTKNVSLIQSNNKYSIDEN